MKNLVDILWAQMNKPYGGGGGGWMAIKLPLFYFAHAHEERDAN